MSVIIPGKDKRVHVLRPHEWATAAGTDYWAVFGGEAIAPTGAVLADFKWVTTSLAEADGSGADFLSSSDAATPPRLLTNASGDLLQSPAVFGDYFHGEQAARFLGYSPTQLSCEFVAAMTVHSANENRSGWGLTEDSGIAGVANDELAWIYTDGSNFTIRSDADSDAGAADDANYHLFKIVLSQGTTDAVEWFIDGTSQGTMDLKTDEFPVSFGMHALTTNRPALSWVHIWYH
jgi:hypothetical protein